jgi:hypothetical protein
MNRHVKTKGVDVETEINDFEDAFVALRNGHVDDVHADQAATVGFAVSGTFIAHGKLTMAEKLELIIELFANRAVIFNWTAPQLAGLFGMSPGSVYKALKGTKARHPRKPADVLTRTWNAADPVARREFAKRVSPEALFDTAVAAVD